MTTSPKKAKKNRKTSTKPRISDDSWRRLETALVSGETLRGMVLSVAKDGLKVKVLEASAILPRAHLSEFPTKLFSRMKGHELDVKIIKLVHHGRKVTVSHDLVLDDRKLKPKTRRRLGAMTQPVAKPEPPLRRTPQCEKCGRPMSRSYRDRCPSCKRRSTHREPPAPRIVQGGSPGLPAKRTMKIGKTKPMGEKLSSKKNLNN
jgi:hypothetical protein